MASLEDRMSFDCCRLRPDEQPQSGSQEPERCQLSTRLPRTNVGRQKLAASTSLLTILIGALLVAQVERPQRTSRGGEITLAWLPRLVLAGAIECNSNNDCDQSVGKICHENKCICGKESPVEDQDRCLGLALIHEPCALTEQCLGNSSCVGGMCECTNEAILLLNRIPNIYYCLPKSRLNEECSFDQQCPKNSYCSTKKYGCICQNGFSPTLVNTSDGTEILECQAKVCRQDSDCETEFHKCEKNKCTCMTTNYDIHSGKCYKNGQSGGVSLDESAATKTASTNGTGLSGDINFRSILKDLSENSDSIWLVLIILISLSLALILLIFMLIRRHYLGYCWTAHKKEYEPNSKNSPKNGSNYFNKNSINNKSFRQKNGELEDDEAEDRSNLVAPDTTITTTNGDRSKAKLAASSSRKPFVTSAKTALDGSKSQNHYVKVDMANSDLYHHQNNKNDSGKLYQHQDQGSPLVTSTSTPV